MKLVFLFCSAQSVTKQRPSWESNSCQPSNEIPCPHGTKSSLLCSQETDTWFCPHESRIKFTVTSYCLRSTLPYLTSIYVSVSQVVTSLQIFQLNFSMHFSHLSQAWYMHNSCYPLDFIITVIFGEWYKEYSAYQ